MSLQGSRYNIPVELRNGARLIYNSMSRSLCLLDATEASELDRVAEGGVDPTSVLTGEIVDQLHQQGLVCDEGVDEFAMVRDLYEQGRNNPQALTLTICPTLACNFGCDYCFQGDDKCGELMSQDVQDGIVALFERTLKEQPDTNIVQFMWYGGEPLLKSKLIYTLSQRLIAVAEANNLNYIASMVSNGYKMNKEVAEKLYEYGLRSVQITLDGSKLHHDQRRHLLSKKGTYDRIVDNMAEWIDDVPIHVNLRVNIDERNRAEIKNLIDDLSDRGFAGKENFKLYFAPVESVTLGCHTIADKMLEKLSYGKLEVNLYRYAYNKGLADIPFPPYFIGICSALRANDFIVVPCGSIHKCWDTVSFNDRRIGNVLDLGDLFDNVSQEKQKWDAFDPFQNDVCSSCKILPNCAGFCAHKFINSDHTIGEASLPCPSLKYTIKEKLAMTAIAQGKITDEDIDPEKIHTDPKEICSEEFDKSKYFRVPAAE